MPATLKYDRLFDLPVYSEVPLLTKKSEFRAAAKDGRASFLRRVIFKTPRHQSIGDITELLRATDEELATIAELCSIGIVRHRWGLYKFASPEERLKHYDGLKRHELEALRIPSNHTVVAEVDVVAGARRLEPYTADFIRIRQQIKDTYYLGEQPSNYRLSDQGPQQCIRTDAGGPSIVQVDIEPRFT